MLNLHTPLRLITAAVNAGGAPSISRLSITRSINDRMPNSVSMAGDPFSKYEAVARATKALLCTGASG